MKTTIGDILNKIGDIERAMGWVAAAETESPVDDMLREGLDRAHDLLEEYRDHLLNTEIKF